MESELITDEMRDWFKKTHSNLDGETFQVIRWNDLHNISKQEGKQQ